jgi:hypothetical protein
LPGAALELHSWLMVRRSPIDPPSIALLPGLECTDCAACRTDLHAPGPPRCCVPQDILELERGEGDHSTGEPLECADGDAMSVVHAGLRQHLHRIVHVFELQALAGSSAAPTTFKYVLPEAGEQAGMQLRTARLACSRAGSPTYLPQHYSRVPGQQACTWQHMHAVPTAATGPGARWQGRLRSPSPP